MKKHTRLMTAPVILALILSVCMSVTVFGAVTYDSSADPVVAYSGMQSYVKTFVADQLKSVNSTISSLSSRLDALSNSISVVVGDLNSVSSDVNTAKGEISSLNSRVSELERNGTGTGTGSAASDSRLAALESALGDLNDMNAALIQSINALDSELDGLEATNRTLSGKVTALEGDKQTLTDRIAALESANSTLAGQLSSIETAYSGIVSELASLSSRMTGTGASSVELELLRERCRKLSAELDGIARAIDTIYTPVSVDGGAVLRAASGSSLIVIVTDGSAAVSFAGGSDGVIDLSEGWALNTGAEIPLMHNILVSGSGSLTITSQDEALLLVGGDYEIVNP